MLLTTTAAADVFENAGHGEGVETSHVVQVTLDDGFARYRVRRTLRNDGEYTDELALSANLPPGAAADGLRVRSGGVWHAGEVMKADAARERYHELTDVEKERPAGTRVARRAPVLLEWESIGSITVRAFPVKPGASITFEYTLVAPTCWGNGRQYLQYPMRSGTTGFVEPLIAVTTGRHGGAVTLHGPTAPVIDEMVCGDGIVVMAGAHTTIEIAPPPIVEAAVRYGLYETGDGNAVARLDIDVAAQLAPVPERARVVFVLDGSWSTGDERLEHQLALVRGYLSHVPDAEVEVVVFRRYAERLFGAFESAEAFDRIVPRVAARRRSLGNGSHLEQGVALAANLLADTAGPARVVVFTDERLRKAYSNDLGIAAASPLPRHAVLHVVDNTGRYGAMNEYRDDDGTLAPLAGAFGGVMLRVGGEPTDPQAVASTMLGLVRPIRIDSFAVVADGLANLESSDPSILAEGEGRRHMVFLDRAPAQVRVTGKIWGRTWSHTLEPHTALSAAVPALVFGDQVHYRLSETEQLAAALDAGAVSMHTAYLAAEDRPVPIPDDEEPMFGLRGTSVSSICGGHSSRCGFSTRCGGGYGTAGRYVEPPRHDDLLRAFMKSTLDNCGRAAGVDELSARLVVEATTTEIVDVTVEGDLTDDLRECLVDGAWDIRLSTEFNRHHHSYAAALHWSR